MKKIQYKNKTIAYTVCKAKVKNLYISIQNGEVVVKAPWYVTSSQIQEVIEEKRKWIIEKIEEYQNSPRKAKTYTDGERYQILGKHYYLNIYFQDINNAKLKVENGMINIILPLNYAEYIHFLTLVSMRMRNTVFLINIRNSNKEWFSDLVSEFRCKTEIAQTFAASDRKSLTFSCYIEAVDMRRFTFHKVSDLDTTGICKFINK